ncbi:hypothetical protein IEQ34_019746 [Dendrobium chrysotoxum]|uniref:Uncharacterized protein n=1 Tax=Dendrobium chrysotoxum TaxID=161865 RepID=A0AAV7GA97_DENCH|nr:hypothetical protein IEQ34_019746 [Dendrobium chrysotoxum]
MLEVLCKCSGVDIVFTCDIEALRIHWQAYMHVLVAKIIYPNARFMALTKLHIHVPYVFISAPTYSIEDAYTN